MGNQLPMDDQWNPVVQKAEPPVQKVVPIQTPTVKVITHEDKPAASDLAPASDRSEDIYQMSMGMQTTTAGADAVVKNVMRGLTVAASFLALIVAWMIPWPGVYLSYTLHLSLIFGQKYILEIVFYHWVFVTS